MIVLDTNVIFDTTIWTDLRNIARNDNQHGKETEMAKVLEGSNSLVFTNLNSEGVDIVDAFVREHPQIHHEGIVPGHRTIGWSNPEEKAMLKALAKKVEDADPE